MSPARRVSLLRADPRDVAGDIARAWKGDYQGQRNVAFCLLTGCDDSIRVDRLTGCAWRIVIVQSGASEVDQSDTLNLDVNCAAKLSRTEKQAAVAKAATIYKKVYGRAAPKFAW
ncbi:hypothetical protein [Chenggangzhangella methanolivorans]|uniref:Uncharacterized protein n=1 Tax=Chenggangzhangella methanolivorans TaxID=1437009 RepID=A0A9E6R9X8_9HYPH|nr:hypothetical protein [Chenggangzhangella methanolivorans]QZN99513.1 hypothetical protein K6K41_22835 [Chenggangzhangella methanolivorans]